MHFPRPLELLFGLLRHQWQVYVRAPQSKNLVIQHPDEVSETFLISFLSGAEIFFNLLFFKCLNHKGKTS